MVFAGDGTAGLVHLGDGDLNGGVVLGLDDAVGGRALAGDVAIRRGGGSVHRTLVFAFGRSLFSSCSALACGRVHEGRLQVHDLATVVLHFDGWGVENLMEFGVDCVMRGAGGRLVVGSRGLKW